MWWLNGLKTEDYPEVFRPSWSCRTERSKRHPIRAAVARP